MKKNIFIIAVSILLCAAVNVNAGDLYRYTLADGVKCPAQEMSSGDLANIKQCSGTERTLVSLTTWDDSTGHYITTLYIVRGNKMKHVQYKKSGVCARFSSRYFPGLTEITSHFGLTLIPCLEKSQRDREGNEQFQLIRPVVPYRKE